MIRVGLIALAALALAGLRTGTAAAAPSAIVLAPDAPIVETVGRFEVQKDPHGERTFDAIAADTSDAGWRLETVANPDYGFESATYWVRFRVANPTDTDATRRLVFRYPLLDRVELYAEEDAGRFSHQVSGDRLPYSARPLDSLLIEFEVRVPARTTRAMYVRIDSTSSMQIGFDVMTPAGEAKAESDLLFWHGAYYGLMLALAIYNFFLFLAIRSRAYLYYVVYAFVFMLAQMGLDGTAGDLLFREHPDLANTFTPFTITLLMTPPLLFAIEFLDTRRHAPRVHRAVTYLIGFCACLLILPLVGPYAIAIRVGAGMAALISFVCLALGVLVIRRGYRPARFYVLAWSSVIAGTLGYILVCFGVLPANAFFSNIMRLGSVAEILLLSFALGDHIATINAERDTARTAAVALERDLAVTGAVQQLFLPKQAAFRSDALALEGFYAPAAQCGGDWWWYEPLPDGRVQVLLGDVTGHGVGAAMVTAAVAAAYRALPLDVRRGDVKQVVAALNASLAGICGGAHHMTLGALEIDVARGTARFWSAGAPALLVMRREGSIEPISASGRPLGARDLVVGEAVTQVGPGDRIFVFSDGLPELAIGDERQLGYRGVTRLLRQTHGHDAVTARAQLVEAITAARGGRPQEDDIAFVVIDLAERAADVAAPLDPAA